MKSLLKQALGEISFENRGLKRGVGNKPERKLQVLFRNRRTGQLKRLRNARYQTKKASGGSWRSMKDNRETKPPKNKKKQNRTQVVCDETLESQLRTIGKKIISSRRSVFESAPQRIQPKEPKSILFADEKLKDLSMDLRDIICS
ncbi:unnamed protein product [Calicophoron daubneyi]|uniref:Uncharacterized protein n=1 Tax=Calicophoron daubneyi TaxID=300641 RepID=A0AAV2THT7_CALDB